MIPFKVKFLDQKFCPLSCGDHVDNQCENDGIIWDCRRHHCATVTGVLKLWVGFFYENKNNCFLRRN